MVRREHGSCHQQWFTWLQGLEGSSKADLTERRLYYHSLPFAVAEFSTPPKWWRVARRKQPPPSPRFSWQAGFARLAGKTRSSRGNRSWGRPTRLLWQLDSGWRVMKLHRCWSERGLQIRVQKVQWPAWTQYTGVQGQLRTMEWVCASGSDAHAAVCGEVRGEERFFRFS